MKVLTPPSWAWVNIKDDMNKSIGLGTLQRLGVGREVSLSLLVTASPGDGPAVSQTARDHVGKRGDHHHVGIVGNPSQEPAESGCVDGDTLERQGFLLPHGSQNL